MEKRKAASPVILDWRRLLGFDQAANGDGAAPLSPKIGPKEARGYSNPPASAAKVGRKDSISLGGRLDAKVGEKNDVRFGAGLPVSVMAKIGVKGI